LEGIKGQPVNLTEGRAFYIGAAFAEWLFENVTGGRPELDQEEEDGSARVSIGMDPRLSGGELAGGLTAGLFSRGVQVTLFGLATTPAMFMSTITPTYEFSGAIMITASHLPFNRNGMKFFTSEGGLEKKNISDILERAAKLCLQAGGEPDSMDAAMDFFCGKDSVAEYTQVNFMRVYADQLRNIIKMGVKHPDSYDTPLEGFRIVVDAGNGSGGFFAEEVLKPLGANITGSKFLEPDGSFPNHIPNPEEAEAMESTTEAVVNSGADLGICFDTDVDRSGVVDETGRQINSNKYIALMAAITLEDFPGTTIVTDSVTSNGLTKFITDLGGKHFRYRRGYKNVIAKGVELNEAGESCELMMETSGHGAMKENFFLDDGAYSAVKVIIEMVRRRISGRGTISQLLESLAEPVESREFRLKIQVHLPPTLALTGSLGPFKPAVHIGRRAALFCPPPTHLKCCPPTRAPSGDRASTGSLFRCPGRGLPVCGEEGFGRLPRVCRERGGAQLEDGGGEPRGVARGCGRGRWQEGMAAAPAEPARPPPRAQRGVRGGVRGHGHRLQDERVHGVAGLRQCGLLGADGRRGLLHQVRGLGRPAVRGEAPRRQRGRPALPMQRVPGAHPGESV